MNSIGNLAASLNELFVGDTELSAKSIQFLFDYDLEIIVDGCEFEWVLIAHIPREEDAVEVYERADLSGPHGGF